MASQDVFWERWRRADARARDAEARLRHAWAIFDRDGTIPADELLEEVAQLRVQAGQALSDLVTGLTSGNFARLPSPQAARDTDPEAA